MKSKKPAGWKMVWADEFEGDVVDPKKWDFDIGNGFFDYQTHTWIPGWGNEELQYYTDRQGQRPHHQRRQGVAPRLRLHLSTPQNTQERWRPVVCKAIWAIRVQS